MWSFGGGDRWTGWRTCDGGRHGRLGLCREPAASDAHAESDADECCDACRVPKCAGDRIGERNAGRIVEFGASRRRAIAPLFPLP